MPLPDGWWGTFKVPLWENCARLSLLRCALGPPPHIMSSALVDGCSVECQSFIQVFRRFTRWRSSPDMSDDGNRKTYKKYRRGADMPAKRSHTNGSSQGSSTSAQKSQVASSVTTATAANGSDGKRNYSGDETRETFLRFFEERGHYRLPSSSLIPRNDPTVLLTTAGMQQMIPYFLGQEQPPHNRLTSVQKCFRTTDIDSVGDASHLTFFEMLGNFSVGDYFKREAIAYAWDLLTNHYRIPAERLFPTVHPDDDEAPRYWQEI